MDLNKTLATAETIHGWMSQPELEWLFQTAQSLPSNSTWVELGVWKGRSFFTVAMGLSYGSKLVGIDSFLPCLMPHPFVPTENWIYDHFRAVFNGVQELRIDLQIGSLSSDTATAAEGFSDLSVDVVFIDADHSQAGFSRDIIAWTPKIKVKGLCCGHDYNPNFPDVVQLVDEYFPDRTIVPNTSIWFARKTI